MVCRLKKLLELIFYGFIVFSIQTNTFATLNASLDEEARVYRSIERLISLGLIDKILVTHKPWPKKEIVRLIREAESHLSRIKDVTIEVRAKRLLKDLKKKYIADPSQRADVSFRPFSEVDVDYLFLDSPERTLPVEIGTSDQIDAFVNPLVAYQRGREYKNTHNLGFETRHHLDLGKYFSVVGRAHFLFRQDEAVQDYMQWGFDELYLRSEFKNIGIQIGRDTLAIGPGKNGGVFHSTNATPLDMLKVSNISPFYYPWFFKYLGPSATTFYLSIQEAEREHDYAYIVGWKSSIQPHRNFEIGMTTSILTGGKGSGPIAVENRIADFFGVFGSLFGANPDVSNSLIGFDFIWRLPRFRGTQLYYEVLVETIHAFSEIDLMFFDQAMHQAGIFLPRLNPAGSKSLRFEMVYSGFRPYRHRQYTSGWTRNSRLMGNELGPDGLQFSVEFEDDPTKHFHQSHQLALDMRDSDHYTLTNDGKTLTKTTDNMTEYRFRWLSSLDWSPMDRRVWSFAFGYERVRHFNFLKGDDQNHFLLRIGLKVYTGT